MITEAILQALGSALSFVLGLLPAVALPGWLDTITTYVRSGVTSFAQLGMWLPVGAIGNVVTFVVVVLGVQLAIRIGRIAVSAFTGGGGSAA